MRYIGFAFTGAVVLFWLAMNGSLVWREIEYRNLDQYRRGVADFLGERVRRERWMGIFRKGQRIGHTGFSIERRLGADSAGFELEFSTRVEIDLFGRGGNLALKGSATLDAALAPELLTAEIGFGEAAYKLSGRRREERFLLTLTDGGRTLFQQALPLKELQFGDGLAPVPPIAGLHVGETYRVPVFDPIFQESAESETRVVASMSREVDGIAVDCLQLETRFRGMVFRSYVTRDGEVVRQEVPPPLDLILVREPVRPVEKKR